jgi:hypothetical protein
VSWGDEANSSILPEALDAWAWGRRCSRCRARRRLTRIGSVWPKALNRSGYGVYRCDACGEVVQFGPRISNYVI